jgi:ribonuclease HI
MIQIYLDGRSTKSGSAFAVVLKHKDTTWKATVSNGLNTLNNTLLCAVEYGILSISNRYKSTEVQINTRSKYVADLFELDESGYYKIVPKNNLEVVTKIRKLIDGRNIKFNLDTSEFIDQCNDLASKMMKSNESVQIMKSNESAIES